MKAGKCLPTMVRDHACDGCGDYAEQRDGKWRHVTGYNGIQPNGVQAHAVKPVPITEAPCYCDKFGGVDWDAVLNDKPSTKTFSNGCVCHQRCYVPGICAYCGPDGCASKGDVFAALNVAVGEITGEADNTAAIEKASCGCKGCQFGYGSGPCQNVVIV
jgi:hypothetical protein